MTKLTVAYHNFANVPKNVNSYQSGKSEQMLTPEGFRTVPRDEHNPADWKEQNAYEQVVLPKGGRQAGLGGSGRGRSWTSC